MIYNNPLVCSQCGKPRNFIKPDACWGKLPGVKYACCGHGEREGYITFENDITIRFENLKIDSEEDYLVPKIEEEQDR